MKLWVRSQDKRTLINTRRIDVDDCNIICWDEGEYASEVYMGLYKSKERALEILDEIQNFILCNREYKYTTIASINELGGCYIYEMPSN